MAAAPLQIGRGPDGAVESDARTVRIEPGLRPARLRALPARLAELGRT